MILYFALDDFWLFFKASPRVKIHVELTLKVVTCL